MNKNLQAFLFALCVALPCFIVPEDDSYFECTVQSERHAALVFYANLGRGFNDDDVSSTTLKAQKKPGLYRFGLPSGKLKGFRLDFIDVDGRVALGPLQLVSKNGTVLQQYAPAQLETKDQAAPSDRSSTLVLTPAAGQRSSSVELNFEKPLLLPSSYNLGGRARTSLPWLLGGFALAWLYLAYRKNLNLFQLLTSGDAAQPLSPPNLAPRIDWLKWTTLTVAAAVLLARMPDRFLYPQFYAEDGYFYACAIEQGAKALVMPYGGYLLTVDRLVAAAAITLPSACAPAFLNYAAFFILLGVLGRIFSRRVKLPCKPLLALAVVLIPRPQDIFLTITNIQWVLALALVLLYFSDDARLLRQHAYDYLAALLIGLTGVFSVLLLPFFAWRALQRKTRTSVVLATVVGATALVQAWLVFTTPHSNAAPMECSPFTIPRIVGLRMFCLMFGGPWLVHPWKVTLSYYAVLSVSWIAFLCYPTRKKPSETHPRWIFAALIAVFAAASIYRFKDMLPLYLSAGYSRYFYLCQVLFIWLLIFELRSNLLRRWIASVALYVYVVTTLCTFQLEPFVDYRWGDYTAQIDRGQDVWMPINPVGWKCHISEIKK